MADADAFQVVRGKKARKLRRPPKQAIDVYQGKGGDEYFNLSKFKSRLNGCIQEICLSEFFREYYGNIETALTQVIAEGIHHSGNKYSRPVEEESIQTGDCKDCSDKDSGNSEKTVNPPIPDSRSTCQRLSENLQSLTVSAENLEEVQLLSYGIGNFTSCLIARYQLAFLLALRDRLGDKCTSCSVYDPVFSNHEIQVLETYRCQVISENEEGKRACPAPTVAFMPHCGKALYNNLLWKNLSTEHCQGLFNLVLVGNSFSAMVDRTPERVLQKTAGYVIKLQPYTCEVQLANTFSHTDVFNDLAIHTFPKQRLEPVRHQICHNLLEPVYDKDDAEFISK